MFMLYMSEYIHEDDQCLLLFLLLYIYNIIINNLVFEILYENCMYAACVPDMNGNIIIIVITVDIYIDLYESTNSKSHSHSQVMEELNWTSVWIYIIDIGTGLCIKQYALMFAVWSHFD